MGVLVSDSVHYRVSEAANSCKGFYVTDDNPPDYDTISGVQFDQGVVPALATVNRNNIARDSVDEETGAAAGSAGTWHYRGECPDR